MSINTGMELGYITLIFICVAYFFFYYDTKSCVYSVPVCPAVQTNIENLTSCLINLQIIKEHHYRSVSDNVLKWFCPGFILFCVSSSVPSLCYGCKTFLSSCKLQQIVFIFLFVLHLSVFSF